MNLQVFLSLVLAHAMIFLPSCKSNTRSSQALEDGGNTGTVTVEQNPEADDIAQQLRKQGALNDSQNLSNIIRQNATSYHFYAQDSKGQIVKLTTEQLRNFDFKVMVKDSSGNPYSKYYLVSKNQESPSFVGFEFNFDRTRGTLNTVMTEFNSAALRAQNGLVDLTQASREQWRSAKRDAVPFIIDLQAQTADQVRKFTLDQSRKIRSFLSRLEQRISGANQNNQQQMQLTGKGGLTKLVLALVAIAFAGWLALVGTSVAFWMTNESISAPLFSSGREAVAILLFGAAVALVVMVCANLIDFAVGAERPRWNLFKWPDWLLE